MSFNKQPIQKNTVFSSKKQNPSFYDESAMQTFYEEISESEGRSLKYQQG